MSTSVRRPLREWVDEGAADWAVWFVPYVLVACYDGSYTVFDRRNGQRVYHGADAEAIVRTAETIYAISLPTALPRGECYEAVY